MFLLQSLALSMESDLIRQGDDQSIIVVRTGIITAEGGPARGGIAIHPDNIVRLYGDVRHAYALSEVVPANKFTRLRFLFTEMEKVNGVGICLYEDYDSVLAQSVKYCFLLQGGNIFKLANTRMVRRAFPELQGNAVNLALGKRADQSSVLEPGDARFAVDGNTNPTFNIDAWQFNTVTLTGKQLNPWWEVDLGEERVIRRIVIYKRTDSYDDDLSDFTVTVRDASGSPTATETFDGVANTTVTFGFDNVIGQKVNIVLNGSSMRVLCLAEVQVFGSIFDFDVPVGEMFNLPEMSVNRLAFIQYRNGNIDLDQESSIITDILFSDEESQNSVAVCIVFLVDPRLSYFSI